jgi:hypothetical protein
VRVELALISMRSQDLRGHNRNPRPASPGSTTEVETDHPLLSCTSMVPRSEQRAKPKNAQTNPEPPRRAHRCTLPASAAAKRNPRGRWRWPILRPRGPTGRVGAGLNARTSPEMRLGSHHDDWAATPQAAPQSLGKTPRCEGMVAPRYQNAGNDAVRIWPPGNQRPDGRSCRTRRRSVPCAQVVQERAGQPRRRA